MSAQPNKLFLTSTKNGIEHVDDLIANLAHSLGRV